jgi:DNA-binding response OmpR family regulator
MLPGKKILYLEDEPYLARMVKDTLELQGYTVMHKKDGGKLMELLHQFKPDLCLFDVMLPYMDGFTLGSTVRNIYPRLPIIFITAKTQTGDLLKGFSSGGTDYIKKPFSMEELMVRIEAQIAMTGEPVTAVNSLPDEVVLKQFRFYPGRYELHYEGKVIKLSNRESQILAMLCTHANKTLERRELLRAVWGDDSFFNSRNLDVYIRKLRSYLSSSGSGIEIITLKGIGYHFSVS